jgi:hypothetical protein
MDQVATYAAAFETQLFTYVPPDMGKKVTFEVIGDDPEATPAFVLLPASGSFTELIAYTQAITVKSTMPEPFYLVVWDNTGFEGYDYTLSVTTEDLPPPEVEPNNTCAEATPIAPPSATDAAMPDELDEDWFVFTATDADVGKVVHVITQPGDDDTDTVVEVFEGDCLSTLGGPSDDIQYHEDWISDPIVAAGDHYIRVSYSSFGFTSPNYELLVTLE